MIHITKEDYERIFKDLSEQIDEENPVATELMIDGCLLTVEGWGSHDSTTSKFWDGAWGAGGWFTETTHYFGISDVTADCVDEEGNVVETDFDASQIEHEWEA